MGDGGIILTSNDSSAEQCRLWSYHGLSNNSWKRYSENSSPHIECTVAGYKFNLTDLQAALGLGQLKRKDELLYKRNKLVGHYNKLLQNVDWIERPVFENEYGKWANHLYVIKIIDKEIDRNKVMLELRKLNIGSNIHFYPVHKNFYYRQKYPGISLPNAEWLSERILSLPLSTKYSEEDLGYVTDALNFIYEKKLAHKTVLV